jgi:hypothetical protein
VIDLWWMSFVDPDRSAPAEEQVPGGGGFLGVAIVEADTMEQAMTVSHLAGINPGGQVEAKGPIPGWAIGPEWRGRLLTAAEAMAIPEPKEQR